MPGRKSVIRQCASGRIYRIIDKNSDKFYIGSAADTTLVSRLMLHQADDIGTCKMHRHFNEVGWQHAVIEELEVFENITVEELLLHENRHLIDADYINNEQCLNRNIAIVTGPNREEHERMMNNRYYENNKERLNKLVTDRQKQLREENPEKVRQHDREKYHENREHILENLKEKRKGEKGNALRERQRKYEKEYRDKSKTTCEICGGTYDCKTKKSHIMSINHQDALPQSERDPQAAEKRQRIQSRNALINVTETCDICGVEYLRHHKQRHERSERHIESMDENPPEVNTNKITCEICETVYNKGDKKRHERTDKHVDAMRKAEPEAVLESNKYKCDICGGVCGKGDKKRHERTKKHQNALKAKNDEEPPDLTE